MKKYLTILFICLLHFNVSATTTHYVSTTGNDATGNGTSGNPWASLAKACTVVTTTGDIIYINAGTYTKGEAQLAVGVNIDGAGQGLAIIRDTINSSNAAIMLLSGTEGTNGNQWIRNITLDGASLTAQTGIQVQARSNVSIYNVTVQNFKAIGINWMGTLGSYYSPPSVFSTGNEMYGDSIINNSSSQYGNGNVNVYGQDGLLIHDCYFNQTARASTYNGDIIGAVQGFNKNFKFYNNTSVKPDYNGANWNFHLETWNNLGGCEMYGNTFIGGSALDVGFHFSDKGASTYSWFIHGNSFSLSARRSSDIGYTPTSLEFETSGGDVLIDSNHFTNISCPIEFEGNSDTMMFQNAYVNHNIFENSGYVSGESHALILYGEGTDTLLNFSIDNNTFKNSDQLLGGFIGVLAGTHGTLKNVRVRNNIFYGAKSFMNFDNFTGIVDSFTLKNNIVYGDASSGNITYSGAARPTRLSETGKIIADPLLNSDFTLQAGSPAVEAGFDGSDIGAIPYTSIAAPTISMSGNQVIITSTTSVSASGTPASGQTITGYTWSKISGTGSITSASSSTTGLTGLSGTSVFRCTVTQSDDQTAYGDVTIIVDYATANAGGNQTITLPTSNITLSGSGTSSDGTISSYAWTQTSGTAATITSPSSATTTVTSLAQGTAVFQLLVTDSYGATATSNVTITVNPAVIPPSNMKITLNGKVIFKND